MNSNDRMTCWVVFSFCVLAAIVAGSVAWYHVEAVRATPPAQEFRFKVEVVK